MTVFQAAPCTRCVILFVLSSAKDSASLMDLNVKLMEEHLLAYQDKSHVWEGFCSGLLPLMGQAKMNSSQTDECVDSLLPV